jgi:hypothetical protein
MKEEKAAFGANTSYYSNQVNSKVVIEYMERAEQAVNSKDYHRAYGFWEKASRIDKSGVAFKKLQSVNREVQQLYDLGIRRESANVQEAMAAWSEILLLVPPGHEFHTKASSKLAWYDQWNRQQ